MFWITAPGPTRTPAKKQGLRIESSMHKKPAGRVVARQKRISITPASAGGTFIRN